MKKLTTTILAVALLCGCSTVYTGIVTITQVRDSALKQLAQLNKAGKLSIATYNKVEAADAHYRQAAEVAEKALIAYKASGDKTQYVQALQAAKAAVSAIIDILNPMIPLADATALQVKLANATKL